MNTCCTVVKAFNKIYNTGVVHKQFDAFLQQRQKRSYTVLTECK